MTHDVIVLGSGPAGLFSASRLAQSGFDVLVVSPDFYADWKSNYGIWVDDLKRWDVPDGLENVWTQPVAIFESGTRVLERGYARLNNAHIQNHLRSTPLKVVPGRMERLEHLDDHTLVHTSEGSYRGRMVVDATGATTAGHDTSQIAAQTAYGILADVDGDPLGGHDMVLMDWRQVGTHDVPTFLYAMRLGDRVFLEETVLAAKPAVPIGELKGRLYERLSAMGVNVRHVYEEERCYIPMNLPVSAPGRVIRVGAAAGFVHPATGYSVARSIAASYDLARALRAHWDEDVDTLGEIVHGHLWPSRRLQTRRFYELGLDVLLQLPPERVPDFFEHFFACPISSWPRYMSDTGTAADIAALMWQVFRKVDPKLKWGLATGALSSTAGGIIRPKTT